MENQEKFILRSTTIWGALVTAASSILPVLGPVVGWTISALQIAEIGEAGMDLINGTGTYIGLIMVAYGRLKAVTPVSLWPKMDWFADKDDPKV